MIINKRLSTATVIFVIMFIIGYLIILLATLKPIGIDNDSIAYLQNIKDFTSINNVNLLEKEISFWVILAINKSYFSNSVESVMFVYIVLQIIILWYAIFKLSDYPLISILLYINLFFILYGLTQIRVGVAIGIFLIAIPDIYNKNFKSYLIKVFIAFLFHYSLLFLFLFYFLNPKTLNKTLYYLLPLIGISFYFLADQYFDTFTGYILNNTPSFFFRRIQEVIENARIENNLTIVNSAVFVKLLFYYFYLINFKKFTQKYDILYFKLYAISLLFILFLSFIPILGVRLSQFTSVVSIIFYVRYISVFNNKYIPFIIIYLYSVYILYNSFIRYIHIN